MEKTKVDQKRLLQKIADVRSNVKENFQEQVSILLQEALSVIKEKPLAEGNDKVKD